MAPALFLFLDLAQAEAVFGLVILASELNCVLCTYFLVCKNGVDVGREVSLLVVVSLFDIAGGSFPGGSGIAEHRTFFSLIEIER